MAQDLDSIGIITEDRDLGGRDENGEEVRDRTTRAIHL